VEDLIVWSSKGLTSEDYDLVFSACAVNRRSGDGSMGYTIIIKVVNLTKTEAKARLLFAFLQG
jgi:hypothetical protein